SSDVCSSDLETGDIARVIAEAVGVVADRREAVGIDDRGAGFPLTALPLPAQCARGMSGRRHRYEREAAEADRLARGNATIDPRGGEGVVHAVLRVFGGLAAALDDGPSLGRGQPARPGTAPEFH